MLGRYLSVRMAHRKNYQRREALLASLETDADLLSGKECSFEMAVVVIELWRKSGGISMGFPNL